MKQVNSRNLNSSSNIDDNFEKNWIINSFEDVANQYPDKLALKHADDVYTYSELKDQVNKLTLLFSNYFKNAFQDECCVIVICLAKTPKLIFSILSALKINIPFLLLDPLMVTNRLKDILLDIQPSVIFTDREPIKYLALKNKINCIDISVHTSNSESFLDNSLISRSDINRPAYVVYTSGSTGKPKGVVVTRQNLNNVINYFKKLLKVGCDDRLLSVTSQTFDIFLLEVLLPLISGATCYLYSGKYNFDSQNIIKQMQAIQPTIMQATPSLWWILLTEKIDKYPNMSVLCGGEIMSSSLANKLCDNFNRVFNLYGPSETTIWSTCTEIKKGQEVSIGKPIANTECFVLDENMKPVLTGEAGELYISGAGVSEGYWGMAEATRRCFKKYQGKCVYKTGDNVKINKKGQLIYLGRADSQIKLLGYRIELAEIEYHLLNHKVIERCSIQLLGEMGKQELVVFYQKIQKGNIKINLSEIEIKAIKNYLGNYLPEYMIPSLFIGVEDFPLTQNGKLDNDKLGLLYNSFKDIPKQQVSENSVINLIHDIWSEVLNQKNIDIAADYLMVGGKSVYIPQILNKINQVFGMALTIREFVTHATIIKLANLVSSKTLTVHPIYTVFS